MKYWILSARIWETMSIMLSLLLPWRLCIAPLPRRTKDMPELLSLLPSCSLRMASMQRKVISRYLFIIIKWLLAYHFLYLDIKWCKNYLILFSFYNKDGFIPSKCKSHINWAFTFGKHRAEANVWYRNMKKITGVDPKDASYKDFQRIYKCNGIWAKDCNDKGLQFPLSCSYPPCDKCAVTGT